MNIATEKAEVLRIFEKVNDPSLIRAVKNLLDFGLSKQEADDVDFEASIDQGLKESLNGNVMPHDQVMREIRARYQS